MKLWLEIMSKLTARQREVLCLVDAGYAAGEIALRLGCATATVRRHLHDARRLFPQLPARELARRCARVREEENAYTLFCRHLALSIRRGRGKSAPRPSACASSSPIANPLPRRSRRPPGPLLPPSADAGSG